MLNVQATLTVYEDRALLDLGFLFGTVLFVGSASSITIGGRIWDSRVPLTPSFGDSIIMRTQRSGRPVEWAMVDPSRLGAMWAALSDAGFAQLSGPPSESERPA